MPILQTSREVFDLFPFLKERTSDQEHELWLKTSKFRNEFLKLKEAVSRQLVYTEELTPELTAQLGVPDHLTPYVGGAFMRGIDPNVIWINTERFQHNIDDILHTLVHEYLHYLTSADDFAFLFKTALSEAAIQCMAADVMYRLTKNKMILKLTSNYLRVHRESSSLFYNALLIDKTMQEKLDSLCSRVYNEMKD